MTNPKVIMLIEAKIQPQRRAELIEAARQYLPLVRAEPGVEAETPLGRLGRVTDIAPLAVFLASDESPWNHRGGHSCRRRSRCRHLNDSKDQAAFQN